MALHIAAYGNGFVLLLVYCREGCTGQYICSGYKGLVAYRTQWQLPAQLPCKRCKLMWTYLTAHNCWWVAGCMTI